MVAQLVGSGPLDSLIDGVRVPLIVQAFAIKSYICIHFFYTTIIFILIYEIKSF